MAEKDQKSSSMPPCLPLNVCVRAWKPFTELISASLLTSIHWAVCSPVTESSSTFLSTWQPSKYCKTASAAPWVLSVLNTMTLFNLCDGERAAHLPTKQQAESVWYGSSISPIFCITNVLFLCTQS